MTLITRIRCNSRVYIASDCQVNKHDNLKLNGKVACKSRIVPNHPMIIGISGLIFQNSTDILASCVHNLSKSQIKTIDDCTHIIDSTIAALNPKLQNTWEIVFMISLIEKDEIKNYTYTITDWGKWIFAPLIYENQFNQPFFKEITEKLAVDPDIFNTTYKSRVSNIDFNINYSHLLNRNSIEDSGEWQLYTRPYTLLNYTLQSQSLDIENLCIIQETNLRDIIREFYINATKVYTTVFKFNASNSNPFQTIGNCNHIIKLDLNSKQGIVLYADNPC